MFSLCKCGLIYRKLWQQTQVLKTWLMLKAQFSGEFPGNSPEKNVTLCVENLVRNAPISRSKGVKSFLGLKQHFKQFLALQKVSGFRETRRKKCNLPENTDSSNGNSPEKGRASQKSLTLGTEIRRKMDRPVRIIDFGNGTSPENSLFSANVPSSPKEKNTGKLTGNMFITFWIQLELHWKWASRTPRHPKEESVRITTPRTNLGWTAESTYMV